MGKEAEAVKHAPRKLKIAILVLGILLALSLLALVGLQIHWYLTPPPSGSVEVPDNVIGSTTLPAETTQPTETAAPTETTAPEEGTAPADPTDPTAPTTVEVPKVGTTISLHNRNPGDNEPFAVQNMMPGDAETKTFCIRVSYQDTVTVRFIAEVREGYEKLAEVMMCRVYLINTDEILYDGLMKDMPSTVAHKLTSVEAVDEDLYYEITAYLDTSVGNEYMRQKLIADFRWYVRDEENLRPPQTGDDFNIGLWAGMAVCSALLLILLLVVKRRKKEDEDAKED